VAGPFASRRLWSALLALAGGLLLCRLVPAADVPRYSRNLPGDSKPVALRATRVFTWTEGNQRVFLLRGGVEIQQDVLIARMSQAVAWTDTETTQRTGVLHFDVYADGDVAIENGSDVQRVARALLDLNTRGEMHLQSGGGKVVQQALSNDPFYREAAAERVRAAAAGSSGIQQTSAQDMLVGTPRPATLPAVPVQGGAGPVQTGPPGTLPPAVPGPTAAPGGPFPGLVPPLQPPLTSPAPPAGQPAVPPPTMPLIPPAPTSPPVAPPAPPRPPVVVVPERQFTIVPRHAAGGFQAQTMNINGDKVLVVTSGVILTVRNVENVGLLDMEGDRLVAWGDIDQLNNMLHGTHGRSRQLEFYLSGNVEIRERTGPAGHQETRTLRANEVYYDVGRNVALAYQADLEFKQPGLPDPVHLRAQEVQMLSPFNFRAVHAETFSSRLPSDPGVKIVVTEATLDEKQVPKRSIFGIQFINRVTGQPETAQQRLFHGDNVVIRLEDYPIFWLPYIQGDANDPLGPLRSIMLNYNRIYGFQAGLTFNAYNLLGMDPIPGTHWTVDTDYLSARGPALGTNYDYAGNDLFGLPGKYAGTVKAYGIHDTGTDILGGGRGSDDNHPDWRGRLLWRHYEELPEDFTVRVQLAPISDKNFLEQYFESEFDRDVEPATYVYVKQQRDNWAWTALVQPRLLSWETETEFLPRFDGFLIGQSLGNWGEQGRPLFTYNAWTSLAYARLRTPDEPPPAYQPTEVPDNTIRADFRNELSLPLAVGPVKVVPYVTGAVTWYSQDLEGNDIVRLYGGAGVRGSMPLTRIYPDIQSDFLNLNGINHKITLGWNYYVGESTVPFTKLPQLDQLNDFATDQALRDITPLQPFFNPQNGVALATSPLFNPQVYAIRQLVDNRVDTLDSINVLQLDVDQRWQTKRGYPGQQHIVDWMTLDLSVSLFPTPNRDNFGEGWAFLQYDWVWNVGDRTALVSTGWIDPFPDGARVFTIGTFLNRPDRTSFYLGYRQIDPLNSKAVSASVTYIFSPKYAITANSTYDFGISASLSNSLILTRMGSDLQVSFGVTYNAILNTFGVVAEIVPNVVAQTHRINGVPAFGASPLGQ
jgi:hypothetical protein